MHIICLFVCVCAIKTDIPPTVTFTRTAKFRRQVSDRLIPKLAPTYTVDELDDPSGLVHCMHELAIRKHSGMLLGRISAALGRSRGPCRR